MHNNDIYPKVQPINRGSPTVGYQAAQLDGQLGVSQASVRTTTVPCCTGARVVTRFERRVSEEGGHTNNMTNNMTNNRVLIFPSLYIHEYNMGPHHRLNQFK